MPSVVSCSSVLIVILFLSQPLCFNPVCAEIWNNEVSDIQYGRLGSNMTLACGTSPNRTWVEWRLNKSLLLPWHQVTSEGGLDLLEVDLSSEGNYSCHDDQGLMLQTIRLRLGQPPGLLSVSCRVPSHSVVLCSWNESVRTHLPGQFYASYRATNDAKVQPCEVDSSHQGCIITQPTMWQPKHLLNVTQTNPLGSHTTLRELRFNTLLKPDPPEDVEVMEMEGYPRMLQVSWQAPSTWHQSEYFPLLFELRYKPVGSTLWSSVKTNSSPLVITDVLAEHPHQLQIRARDDLEDHSLWSDWSPLLQAWAWRAPEAEGYDEEILPLDLDNSDTDASTASSNSHNLEKEEDGGVGLVVLLSLFAAIILTTVASIFILVWVRQRRRGHVTNEKLTSLVKLKSMPI